jgi:cation:H+ antiporter
MGLVDFGSLSPWVNLLVLVVAGIVVWLAGSKLATLAEAISIRTGLTSVLAGALLLGTATSLPEVVTTVTAGALGNAPLAVNNLFGGVAMQLAVLAFIDFRYVKDGPLTFFSPAPVLLLSGVLLILQCSTAIVAVAVGDVAWVGHIGLWPIALFIIYLVSLYFMNRFANRETWMAANVPEALEEQAGPKDEPERLSRSTAGLAMLFALNCVFVLVGGWAVSTSADALAEQTGIGSSFIGATLVAITTSLPEISTAAGAVRLGAYTMAISNIFGTNTLEVALLLPADISYGEGAVMNAVDQSALLMAALGILMTCIYLWGLLERRDKSFCRMGVDSWWVILVYLGGLAMLYHTAMGNVQ